VLEGLLPAPHNKRLLKLLFVFANWHGLAKLRLHTDHTVNILDHETTRLGEELRDFVKLTCDSIATQELRREYEARKRREASKGKKGKGKAVATSKGGQNKGKGKALNKETDDASEEMTLTGKHCIPTFLRTQT
jgi:hypothetical protein